jgi:predicted small lipoprotein YifL
VHTAPIRLVCLFVALVCLAAIPGLLTGCGSEGPQLPDVAAGVTVGPRSGEATVTVKSSGTGAGVAAVVLTYPNGHRRQAGQGVLEDGLGLGWGVRDLPPGRYTYTVYAVATPSVPEAPTLPAGARADKNIIASGTFVID